MMTGAVGPTVRVLSTVGGGGGGNVVGAGGGGGIRSTHARRPRPRHSDLEAAGADLLDGAGAAANAVADTAAGGSGAGHDAVEAGALGQRGNLSLQFLLLLQRLDKGGLEPIGMLLLERLLHVARHTLLADHPVLFA